MTFCLRIPPLALLLCAFAALLGCASPGIPRPPSLHLPAPVADISAVRVSDRVELHWTAPRQTTDGLDINFPTQVEICRDPAAAPNQCTVVLTQPGHDGPSSATDSLPQDLLTATAPRSLLAYRIRVSNANRRSAAPSATVLVPAGPSPAGIEDFRAIQQRDGVLLRWKQPSNEAGVVEILRTPYPPPSSGSSRSTPIVHLRSASSSAAAGMLDQGALLSQSYTYQAQRVLNIPVAGKSIAIRSELSSPLTVAMRDTFPPGAPRGLVTIPGPPVDLSWQPNAENDVAGYLVYRTDVTLGELTAHRLTSQPLAGPSYRDAGVLPGHRYEYRVTAVDRAGNESTPSAPAAESPEPH